jgi:hypothetical protein
MTEQEYIDAQELEQSRTLVAILTKICPKNSSVIPVEEHKEVLQKVHSWMDKLSAEIKIKG